MKTRSAIWLLIVSLLAACAAPTAAPTATVAPSAAPTPVPVKVMLDWTPNVNHTGLFVAEENGYFAEAGLKVDLIQPGEVYAEQAVASGAVDFGISFQEQVTLLRSSGTPLVSIAALIQHNTTAFASRAGEGLDTPAGWTGKRYGSFGSPFESPTLRTLMACVGGDFSQVQIVETGYADPLALLAGKQIDLAWIFFGTQGLAAEQQKLKLDLVRMDEHFDCVPDYYTPVLIASESTLKDRPGLARAFLFAVSRGYQYAINNPDQAARVLLTATPESGAELIQNSQRWLSPRYQADAPRWGEQKLSVWDTYSRWMAGHAIIPAPIDAAAAFSNDFLP